MNIYHSFEYEYKYETEEADSSFPDQKSNIQ